MCPARCRIRGTEAGSARARSCNLPGPARGGSAAGRAPSPSPPAAPTKPACTARRWRARAGWYSHDEGPCLHSLATGQVVVVDDLASDDRWGGYQMPALGHGVRSSLSLPLHTDAEVIGALNIYATQPRTFGPPEQLVAGRFADEASRALTLAVRIVERTEMSEHLRNALTSRAVIDQALGIIMGQNRCTADEAFEVLRTTSQNRNINSATSPPT